MFPAVYSDETESPLEPLRSKNFKVLTPWRKFEMSNFSFVELKEIFREKITYIPLKHSLSTVVAATHGKKHNVFAQFLCKGQGNRN